MLERVSKILGAFESADGKYAVFALEPDTYKEHMRPTRSRGPSAGKVGIVSRSAFEKLGSVVATGIHIDKETGTETGTS